MALLLESYSTFEHATVLLSSDPLEQSIDIKQPIPIQVKARFARVPSAVRTVLGRI